MGRSKRSNYLLKIIHEAAFTAFNFYLMFFLPKTSYGNEEDPFTLGALNLDRCFIFFALFVESRFCYHVKSP